MANLTDQWKGALTGKAESAYLTIWDTRQTGVGASAGAGGVGGQFSDLAERTTSALTGGTAAVQTKFSISMRRFTVQFNPSSLALYSNSIEVKKQDTMRGQQSGEQRVYVDSATRPWVELSVDLIFDRVNNADAFMWDKMRLGVGNAVASGVAYAVKGGKTVYTVQTEVEGFLAAIRNSHTREVTFAWGQFNFQGVLKDMVSEYTMFSVSGRPIRALVSLRIRQKQLSSTLSTWRQDFEKAFGASSTAGAASGLRSATNLLNIGK